MASLDIVIRMACQFGLVGGHAWGIMNRPRIVWMPVYLLQKFGVDLKFHLSSTSDIRRTRVIWEIIAWVTRRVDPTSPLPMYFSKKKTTKGEYHSARTSTPAPASTRQGDETRLGLQERLYEFTRSGAVPQSGRPARRGIESDASPRYSGEGGHACTDWRRDLS